MSKHTVRKTRTKKKPVRGVLGRIKPIGFDDNDGIKINLYGRSGTGKTTTWATFPKPILAIVCSGSNKTGELRSIDTEEYRKTIEDITIEKSSEIAELVEYQNESEKYATVVLDHASGLQDLILKEILGIDELPAQLGWGIAKMQDWGQCSLKMKETFRALLSLSANVVIVAQEREFNMDSESDLVMPYVASAVTPSVVGWLNPACDYICQTFKQSKTKEVRTKIGKKLVVSRKKTDGVDYCLRTGPHEVFTTKFRIPKGQELPEFIVDPSYAKIMALINQS